jgi:putative membrane protein
MAARDLALAAHFIGLALWMGGGVVAASVAGLALSEGGEGKETALRAARKAVIYWATPGMLIAWAGGLTVLIPDFGAIYASAGWMHAKLTLLVVLTAVTGVFTGRLRRAASGQKASGPGPFNVLGLVLAVGLVLVVVLAKLKPF